jgi:DNA uptake protein ComE-like DNA-binding protein
MAKRASQQRRTTSRNQWVPRGIGKPAAEDIAPKPPSKSGDTDEWLAIPRPSVLGTGGNGHANGNGNGHSDEASAEAAQEPRPLKKRKLPKRATARERWLINRLRRSKQRVEEQQEEIDKLKAEITELRGSEPKPRKRKAPPNAKAKAKARKVDLQKASFEDLRGLGLSVTQSARLIAYRDTGPGFASVDELDAIPGFADATIGKLRDRARVGSR